jgi:hypothetical protein
VRLQKYTTPVAEKSIALYIIHQFKIRNRPRGEQMRSIFAKI